MTAPTARRFARVVVMDWSANARPKRGADSIWIASLDTEPECPTDAVLFNPPTRAEAVGILDDLIDGAPGPTLLGVDFSLGFPRGTAASLEWGERLAWEDIWAGLSARIVDGDDNHNNRFDVAGRMNAALGGHGPGPFWGCPQRHASDVLTPTKPPPSDGWPPRWRFTERALMDGGQRPFDCWQLLGAGSVASQSLMGIPAMHGFRDRHGGRVVVWPFTTGLDRPPCHADTVVVAELWPSQRPVHARIGEVRDAAQVRSTACWLADADRSGELDALFAPALCDERRRSVEHEEGWVLGVAAPTG